MPQLRGTLEPTELPALVRFLCDVGATGCLRLAGARRAGALWLDGGRLVAARSGASRGRAALDAVALPEGEFVFAGDDDPPEPDPELVAPRAGDPLRRLQAAAGRWARLGPLLAARWALAPPAEAARGEALTLDRESLRVLLAVGRGEHRLEAIAGGGDLLATAEALQSLRDLGLVRAEGGAHRRGSRDRLRRGRERGAPGARRDGARAGRRAPLPPHGGLAGGASGDGRPSRRGVPHGAGGQGARSLAEPAPRGRARPLRPGPPPEGGAGSRCRSPTRAHRAPGPGPATLTNTATVANQAGPDAGPSTNSVSVQTHVVARADLGAADAATR